MNTIAIEFGSARTKVAALETGTRRPFMLELGREVRSILPSVFHIAGDGTIRVGDEAIAYGSGDPAGVVRRLSSELHRPEPIYRGGQRIERRDLITKLFEQIRNDSNRHYFPEYPITDCILVVRSSVDSIQRDILRDAAVRAGFQAATIKEAPLAALDYAAAEIGLGTEVVIVGDVGGENTEFTLLERSPKGFRVHPASMPIQGCGADSIEGSLWDAIVPQIEAAGLPSVDLAGVRQRLRQLKESFARFRQDKEVVAIATGHLEISRDQMSQAMNQFTRAVEETLARFKTACSTIDISQAPILLVGGGSRLEGLSSLFKTCGLHGALFASPAWEFAAVLGAVCQKLPDKTTNASGSPSTSKQVLEHSPEAERQLTGKTCLFDTEKEAALAVKEVVEKISTDLELGPDGGRLAPRIVELMLEWGSQRWNASTGAVLEKLWRLFFGLQSVQNSESSKLDKSSILSHEESLPQLRRIAFVAMKEQATAVQYVLRLHLERQGRFWEQKVMVDELQWCDVPSVLRNGLMRNGRQVEIVLFPKSSN